MANEDSINEPGSENDDEFTLRNRAFNKKDRNEGELRLKRRMNSQTSSNEIQDTPNLVIKSAVRDRELCELEFLVDWKRRLDGIKPEPTWMRCSNLKGLAPELLCDYLLKHVKFPETPRPENIL